MLLLPAGREASSGVGAPVYTRHRPGAHPPLPDRQRILPRFRREPLSCYRIAERPRRPACSDDAIAYSCLVYVAATATGYRLAWRQEWAGERSGGRGLLDIKS